jgi:rubrerythrin
MKRVLQIVGVLKKLTGHVDAASQTPMNLNGQDTVLINPEWMKELSKSLDSMAEMLMEVVAERLSEPHQVSDEVGWVCVKCIRIWAEDIEECPICHISKDEAKGEEKETK